MLCQSKPYRALHLDGINPLAVLSANKLPFKSKFVCDLSYFFEICFPLHGINFLAASEGQKDFDRPRVVAKRRRTIAISDLVINNYFILFDVRLILESLEKTNFVVNSFILADIKQHMGEWLQGEIVAGNTGLQILVFFLCVFGFWLIARITKSWTGRLEANSKSDSSRSVFLNAIGKSLPLLGVWTGIRVGVNFINLGPSGEFTKVLF